MITLISTPECITAVSPEITSRWVATESPVIFNLLRHDYDIVSAADNGGYLRLTVAAGIFDGAEDDIISVFNKSTNAMYVGIVQAGSTTTVIDTDIPFISGFDPADPATDPDRDTVYFNDNTLHGGYYCEGRLTINGVLNNLTIIASPNSFGFIELDVSGILRIATSIGKVTDYSDLILADTNKSGNFSLEYRECWYGSDNAWIESESVGSPIERSLWYYAECVRSVEQGSNLTEYVPSDIYEAPFLNLFYSPVYFRGLPFDISFILPERVLVSPAGEITVTIRAYNSSNTLLSEVITPVTADDLEGHVCSLNIAPESIAENTAYFTAEITTL